MGLRARCARSVDSTISDLLFLNAIKPTGSELVGLPGTLTLSRSVTLNVNFFGQTASFSDPEIFDQLAFFVMGAYSRMYKIDPESPKMLGSIVNTEAWQGSKSLSK